MSIAVIGRLRSTMTPSSQVKLNLALAGVLALLLGLRSGGVHSLQIASINMAPTLEPHDRVLVRSFGGDPGPGDVVVYRTPFGTGHVQVGRIVAIGGSRVAMDEFGLRVDDRAVAVAVSPGDACDEAAEDSACAGGSCASAATLPAACEIPKAAAEDAPAIAAPAGSTPAPPAGGAPADEDRLIGSEQLGSRRWLTRKAGALAALLFPERTVPEGHVFVLNDNRVDERDSRIYGAIPLSAVVGVATFVYYANDGTGIRWDRMSRRIS